MREREKDNLWFYDLYRRNANRLVQVGMRTLKEFETCQDLMQETFYVLLIKMDEVRAHPNIDGWLIKVNSNLLKRELNSPRRLYEIPLPDWLDVPVVDTYRFPLGDLLPKELTERERKLLILHYEKEMPYKEIAQLMKISSNYVGVLMHRARRHLREIEEKNEKLLS